MGPRAEQTPPVASCDAPVGQLWADDLCVDHVDDALSISLRLQWEGPTTEGGLPSGRRLRLEVSDLDRLGGDRRRLLAAQTPPNATALVPLLAAIAATTGADLTIDAPVCPTALAGARRAIAVGQVAHGWSAVTLGATAGASGPTSRGGDALVFALDLESLATLVEQRGGGRPPTHLLAIDGVGPTAAGSSDGYQLPGSDERTGHWRRSWRTEAMAANATRLPLVRASTNARQLGIPRMGSTTAGQATTAACALALAGVVGSVTLSGEWGAAGAITPDTTSLWSSGAVRLDTTATRRSVTDAAALVASEPWALQWLQVCPATDGNGNCGACAPCQFALTTLWLAGAPDADLARFDRGVNPSTIRTLAPRPLHQRSRRDHLELIDALTVLATAGDPGASSAVADDRFLAAALADAWGTYLNRVDARTEGSERTGESADTPVLIA